MHLHGRPQAPRYASVPCPCLMQEHTSGDPGYRHSINVYVMIPTGGLDRHCHSNGSRLRRGNSSANLYKQYIWSSFILSLSNRIHRKCTSDYFLSRLFGVMPPSANELVLLSEPSLDNVEHEHQRLVRVPGDQSKFGNWSLVALILVSARFRSHSHRMHGSSLPNRIDPLDPASF
jgi:hypothetical protein